MYSLKFDVALFTFSLNYTLKTKKVNQRTAHTKNIFECRDFSP